LVTNVMYLVVPINLVKKQYDCSATIIVRNQ